MITPVPTLRTKTRTEVEKTCLIDNRSPLGLRIAAQIVESGSRCACGQLTCLSARESLRAATGGLLPDAPLIRHLAECRRPLGSESCSPADQAGTPQRGWGVSFGCLGSGVPGIRD
jgi:hypothetical protein